MSRTVYGKAIHHVRALGGGRLHRERIPHGRCTWCGKSGVCYTYTPEREGAGCPPRVMDTRPYCGLDCYRAHRR